MAKVYAPFPIERTMCGLTFYKANGQNLVRKKSSLGRRRVKTGREFALTRHYANLLKQASQIASVVYRSLPVGWRQYWMFHAFTGEAMQLLKTGKTVEEAIAELKRLYVLVQPKYEGQIITKRKQGPAAKEKRKYIKKDNTYWLHKSAKATKRKAQKEKLQYYAGLLTRASKIGSVVYQSLPVNRRQYRLYKLLTGQAMRLLQEGLEDEQVLKFLKRSSGNEKQPGAKYRELPVLKEENKNIPAKRSGNKKARRKTLCSIPSLPVNYRKKRRNRLAAGLPP